MCYGVPVAEGGKGVATRIAIAIGIAIDGGTSYDSPHHRHTM